MGLYGIYGIVCMLIYYLCIYGIHGIGVDIDIGILIHHFAIRLMLHDMCQSLYSWYVYENFDLFFCAVCMRTM